MFRIGLGHDTHRLGPGDGLVIGGDHDPARPHGDRPQRRRRAPPRDHRRPARRRGARRHRRDVSRHRPRQRGPRFGRHAAGPRPRAGRGRRLADREPGLRDFRPAAQNPSAPTGDPASGSPRSSASTRRPSGSRPRRARASGPIGEELAIAAECVVLSAVDRGRIDWQRRPGRVRGEQARCKRHVARRMPVLREDHTVELPHQPVDRRQDRLGVGHWQTAARAEVHLHVHDHQGGRHGHDPRRLRRNPTPARESPPPREGARTCIA